MTRTTLKLTELLDSKFLARLDGLDVISRKIIQGKLQGERRSKRRGEGVEFADHRPYVAGDDLRFLPGAIKVARQARRSIRVNLGFAAAYNAAAERYLTGAPFGRPETGWAICATAATAGLVPFELVTVTSKLPGLTLGASASICPGLM